MLYPHCHRSNNMIILMGYLVVVVIVVLGFYIPKQIRSCGDGISV